MNHFCSNDSLYDEDLNQLLLQYDGKINYEWISDEKIKIEPLFFTHERFRNMDGYFMIGDKIEAEIENYRIEIYNGNWQKLNTLTSNPNFPQDSTLYDADSTIFVTDRAIGFGNPCCDNSNEDEQFYNAGDEERRLQIGYVWADMSDWNPATGMAIPIVATRRTGDLRKKNWLGRWTSCHRRHWEEDFRVDWWVVPTTTIENERIRGKLVNRNNSAITWWGCEYGLSRNFNSSQIGPYGERPDRIACVFDISYEVEIWTGDCASQETTFAVECSNWPPPVCQECPDGWIYNKSYRRCEKNDPIEPYDCIVQFIWNGGLYYHSHNGQCLFGGTPSGTHCYIGHLPAGWYNDAYIDDGCVYIKPRCN